MQYVLDIPTECAVKAVATVAKLTLPGCWPAVPFPIARKMAQEQQQYEHAAADWERWKGRVQDEIEAAQVGGWE